MGHVPDFDHLKNLQNGQRMDIQADASRRASEQPAAANNLASNIWSISPTNNGADNISQLANSPVASTDDGLKRDGWGQGHKARKNTEDPAFAEQVPVRPPDRPAPQADNVRQNDQAAVSQNLPTQMPQGQPTTDRPDVAGAKGPSQAEIAAASRELKEQMQQQQQAAETTAKAPERKPAQNPRRTLNALVSAMNPAQIAQAKANEAQSTSQPNPAVPFPAAPDVAAQRNPGNNIPTAQTAEANLSAAEKLQIQAANLPPELAQLHKQILEAQSAPPAPAQPVAPQIERRAIAPAPVEPRPEIPAVPQPAPPLPQAQPTVQPYNQISQIEQPQVLPAQPAAPYAPPQPAAREPWEIAAAANPQPVQPPWDKVESTAVPPQFAAREPWELAVNNQAQVTHSQIFQQPVKSEPVLPSPDTPAGHYLKFLQNSQNTERPALSAQSALTNVAQPESRAFEVQPLDVKLPSPVDVQRSSHLNLRVESINPEVPKPAPETSRLLSLIFTDNDPFEAANCSQTFRIDTVSGIKTMTTMLPDNSSTRIECTREDGCKTITISENLRSATAISARPLCVRDLDSQGNITSETKYNYHNVNDLCTPTSKKVITGGQVIQFNLDPAGRVTSQIILPPDQG